MNPRTIVTPFLMTAALILSGWIHPRPASAAQQVFYVKPSGSDGNNCLSWSTPCQTLGAAVSLAQAGDQDQVWVAAGTYALSSTLQTTRDVSLYGGFAGNETTLNARDWRTYVSQITGQVVQNFSRVDGFTFSPIGTAVYGCRLVVNNTLTGPGTSGVAIAIGNVTTALNNRVTNFHFGIAIADVASALVANNVIIGNAIGIQSPQGGTFVSTIVNNSVVNNSGDGISAVGTYVNNVVAFNGGYGVVNINHEYSASGGESTSNYNDVYSNVADFGPGISPGSNDTGVDPLFVSRGSGDLHLQAGSPAVNSGDNSVAASAGALDFDGNPRIFPNAGTIDRGAYEYVTGSFVPTPTFSPPGGTYDSPQTVTLADTDGSAQIRYTTDGSIPTTASPIYSSPVTVGQTGVLQAIAIHGGFNTSAAGVASYTILWHLLYVNAAASGPTHDGHAWSTAFLTLGEAVSASLLNGQIWLAAGTYTPGSTVSTSQSISLYGGFGGTETLLSERNWRTHVSRITGQLLQGFARVDGVTISNVYSGISGCVIVANSTVTGRDTVSPSNTGIGSVTTALNNIVTNFHLGIVVSDNITGLVADNLVTKNVVGIQTPEDGVTASTIANNTVVDNSGDGITGVGSFTNNIVAFNGGYGIVNINAEYGQPGGGATSDYNISYGNGTNFGPGVSAGVHDLVLDPIFVNHGTSDLHLQSTSPALNVGDNSVASQVGTVDLDGNPRIYAAGTIDLGAYELQQSAGPTAPQITTQPAAQSVVAGNMATFSVTATGALTYQWQKASPGTSTFADISGATSASYTTPATILADDASRYQCVVGNLVGPTTSGAATLTVTAAPVAPAITSQPAASQTRTVGQSVTFAVSASGTSPLSYQWQFNDAPIAGGPNSPTYTISAVALANAGNYRCVVNNATGIPATSQEGILVIAVAAPVITLAPQTQTAVAGQVLSLSVAASGTGPFTYQWQRNGSPISGATLATYDTVVSLTDDGASFTCSVSNPGGATVSDAGVITVITLVKPQITFPTFASVNQPLVLINTSAYDGLPVQFDWTFSQVPAASLRPSNTPQSLGAPRATSVQTLSNSLTPQDHGIGAGTFSVSVSATVHGVTSAVAQGVVTLTAANLTAIRVFPNPWRADLDSAVPITFDHLPIGSTIKLYTVSGHWIKTLTAQTDTAAWDRTNDSGDKVASGLYLYLITDPQGNKKTGEFAIVK